ncbi:MAG: hypothetical protein CVU39_24825 [Chloroflexi bacterium HGW-Chloroflexi-10]|nr:MAG: hypothetical protein CVU39_24825 [Chloroflexi bacterium HGW-Chloroflexi-10]
MKTKWVLIISILLALVVLAVGLALEPRFPQEMATHWNAEGIVDGYGSHFVGIWLLPIMIVSLTGLMLLIPSIDPRKENIAKFRKEYNLFILFFAVFFTYLQLLTLAYNLGYPVNMITYLIPVFGIFIFFAGVLIGKAQPNYFIGIRTPWTLQDDRVWALTHKRGAVMFKISGLITLLGLFLPGLGIWLLLVPIVISTVYVLIYSYVQYRKLHPQI